MACALPEQSLSKNSPKNRHRPSKENWRTVKLFITSYNDDFFSEREVLRKQVLPDLKAWCETKKVRLQECSVKWGGRHPDKRDMTDLEKIQTAIENCYYNNVMPLFINLTSESLGWIPMWGEYDDEMVEDFLEAYGLLVEDLEVMYGAYREDNHNSLFVIRSDTFLESVPEEEKCNFAYRARASDRLQEMGYKITKKFPLNRFLQYSCRYKGLDSKKRKPKVEVDDCFRKRILDFCKERISIDYCGEFPTSNNPYTLSKQSQNTFLKRKSAMVIGREDILDKIEAYITHEEKDVPLLLLGGPGSGKSSILCKAAELISSKAQKRQLAGCAGGQWHVFYHFVGAVPGSTTLEPMLKRLLSEMEVTSESSMPKNLEAAAQMVCSLLSNPNTKPLIIFVDALNQVAEDQAALVMSWLPRKLVPQVRCVFSLINDTPQHLTLMSRETKPLELQITPLDMQSRKGIIEEMLGRYRRSLSESQVEKLLAKESSENPLWLSVACEEIRLIDDSSVIDSTIDNLADGLLNLLEQLLTRFEGERGGHLIVATLCLLESSNAGLLESELRHILGNEATLMPPSPFDEKEEKETSEKESVKQSGLLTECKWNRVFSTLKPFLRPFGESTEGRLDFYHRALSKAVRKKYFQKPEDAGDADVDGCADAFYWWHKKLADFFEGVDNVDRLVEEYPYHLVCLEDKYRLAKCLCDWSVFDKLYHEEFSSQLLVYWRKVGSSSEMVDHYKVALSALEEDVAINEELLSIRYEKVCRVVIQAGKYLEALELLKTAMKIEERELGARPYRMVELYALMAEIYDEKLKLSDFVSPSQLPDLRKTITYGRKSISLRKQFSGNYHRFKLAMSLMRLAFSLESWEACGGAPEMTGEEALAEGNKYIDMALKIFQELNDMGHYAEALMTKGVLAPRGSMEQLKYYNQAMDLCMQIYGEYHILTSRLYINIGIVYEDNGDYKKAYEYFKKWARVSEEILGPEHPKTLRAKGVLKELRYRQIAQQLGEWDYEEHGHQSSANDDDDEDVDNGEIIDYYDDIVQAWNDIHLHGDNNLQAELNNQDNNENFPNPPVREVAMNASNENNVEIALNGSNANNVVDSNVANNDQDDSSSDDSDINDHGALMNGYYDEDRDNVDEGNNDDNEFEDNDLSYDDNFEDYDEQYILHLDNEPVIDEFNVQGLDYGDEDCEIVEMAERDVIYNYHDNRYASDRSDTN
ncbi:TPR repeat-containing protein DDB_G0287407-like isoform X2 [Liolophura sinensis]|uniref:TPR repeat-containing protein DDB_G0287407-like isoform X2 n=1 Tax=Liolophura sinensis TaxID=3198878 RepID=UPI003158E140